MLNNCKEKGEKLERMGKNSRVGIFIRQHIGIAGTFRKPCCINILVHFFAKNSST